MLEMKREKLSKKAELDIFIGYSDLSKAYRVYHPLTGKFSIHRDLKFNEDLVQN